MASGNRRHFLWLWFEDCGWPGTFKGRGMASTRLEFLPPFCPRSNCPSHGDGSTWTYRRAGFYSLKASPHRIPRYNCRSCGASFSQQSFKVSYYLKRPDLLVPVFHRLVGCSGFRQIAREFAVSHTTIMRLSERLGRHCLLFNHRAVSKITLDEPVVMDGFESYAYSQYYPFHFHLALTAKSHFLLAFTDSELRRKGRMTDTQKRRRAELEARYGRPDPKSIEKEVAKLLRLLPPASGGVTLSTDDHPAYPRGIARSQVAVRHEVTSSKARRTTSNKLFPVNLADLLVRHCSGNHKRETIAASKTRQNAAERLLVFQVFRNYVKSFSERRQDATPAMRIGVTDRKWTVAEVLEKRLFPWGADLPERLQDYYWRRISTGHLGRSRLHALKFAA